MGKKDCASTCTSAYEDEWIEEKSEKRKSKTAMKTRTGGCKTTFRNKSELSVKASVELKCRQTEQLDNYSGRERMSPDLFNLPIADLKVEQDCENNDSCLDQSLFYTVTNPHYRTVDVSLMTFEYCDLLLVCGPSAKTYQAHRAVFASCSPVFSLVLSGQELSTTSVVHLPDHNYEDLVNLTHLLYFGFVSLPLEDSISLQSVMKELQIDVSSSLTPGCGNRQNFLNEAGFIYDSTVVKSLPVKTDEKTPEVRRSKRKRMVEEVDIPEEGMDLFRPLGNSPNIDSLRPSTPNSVCGNFDLDHTIEPPSPTYFSNECDVQEKRERIFYDSSSSPSPVFFESIASSPLHEASFDSFKPLRNSVLQKNKPRRVSRCLICEKEFSYKILLIHMKKEHEFQGQTFFCQFCPEVFLTNLQRNDHELSHPENQEVCDLCGFVANRRKMRLHRERQHVSKTRRYQCEICSQTVAVADKVQHLRTHSERIARFKCDQCDKLYYGKHSLLQHVALVHNGIEAHRCTACKKTFDSKEEKNEHAKSHVKRDGKVCSVCSERVTGMLFFTHMRRHAAHEIASGNHLTCPRCDRIFLKPEFTINHMIGHLDPPRPSECDICFLPSKTAALAEKHKIRDHLMPRRKKQKRRREPKPCVKCGQQVADGEMYKKHLLLHAWADLGCQEADTDVQCSECFRIFECALHAVNHFLCHYEADRVIECNRCCLMVQNETALAFHQSRCIGKKMIDPRRPRKAKVEKKEVGVESRSFAWLCSECALVFETEQECEAHCALFHSYEEVLC